MNHGFLAKVLSVNYISVKFPVLAEDSAEKENKAQEVEKARLQS